MEIIKIMLHNPSGLHARPASKLCAIAKEHEADCLLVSDSITVDVKKILDLMAANFQQGTQLEIRCQGKDDFKAAEEIRYFIENLTE